MRTLVTLAVRIAAGLAPAGAAGASAQAAVGSLAQAAPVRGVSGHHVAGVAHEKRAGAPPTARLLASATIALTFTPVSGTPMPLAPAVPPVVHGRSIHVHYDLAGLTGFTEPQLVVSPAGHVNPLQSSSGPATRCPCMASP